MLKKNDIIQNKIGYYRKILSIADGLYFVSIAYPTKEDAEKANYGEYFYTLQALKDAGYEIPEEKWIPEKGETCWYIDDFGEADYYYWGNDENDHARRDFLGIYPTKEAAQERLEEIKRLIK